MLLSDCHVKYSRAAERGDVDKWLTTPNAIDWVGAVADRGANGLPSHPMATALKPAGASAASSIEYYNSIVGPLNVGMMDVAMGPPSKRRKKITEPLKALYSKIDEIWGRSTTAGREAIWEGLDLWATDLGDKYPGKTAARGAKGGAGATCLDTPAVKKGGRGHHAGESRKQIVLRVSGRSKGK